MNVDYSTVFSLAPFVNENIVTIIGICLLIGAMAKSSQVGLHVWLPMAIPFYGKCPKRPYNSNKLAMVRLGRRTIPELSQGLNQI